METKSQLGSTINWIAFAGGGWAFFCLCVELYNTGTIDIDKNTNEHLFYFTAAVITYVRRTYFHVKPVRKKAVKK